MEFLPIKKIGSKDGLSSPNVRKITQDKYGFIWFATQDGLSRFDGTRFKNFTGNDRDIRKSLLSSDVFDVQIDNTGNYLWALTAYGGLHKIDIAQSTVIERYSLQTNTDIASDYWLKCMAITESTVLIGSNESVVIKFNMRTKQTDYVKELSEGHAETAHLDDILVDSLKRVWFFYSNYGIIIKDEQLSTTIAHIPAGKLNNGNTTIEFTDKTRIGDKIFIATSCGLRVISMNDFSIISSTIFLPATVSYLGSEPLNAIFSKNNNLSIAGRRDFIILNVRSGQWKRVLPDKHYEDKEWFSLSNTIFQDEKSIWLGSQYGIAWIKRINPNFVAYYSSMNGNNAKIEHSMTLLPVNDSVIYVCSDLGIYRVNYRTSVFNKIVESGIYYSIGRLTDNFLLISGVNGSSLISDNGKLSTPSSIFPELKPLETDALVDIQNLGDSLYFFSSQSQKGLHIWDRKKKTFHTLSTTSSKTALKSNVINRVFIDSRKNAWVICDDVFSILDVAKNKIETLSLINYENNQPLSINMDMCELNGEYWIASYGTGIVKLDKTKKLIKIYGSKNGINNLGIYKIFGLNDSTIIASSNNGLVTLNIRSEKINNFFEEDGLQSNNFEETSGNEYGENIFFGGIKGFTKVDKRSFLADTTFPSLLINSIEIQTKTKTFDTSFVFLKKINIPSNTSLVTVRFSSLHYFSPEKLKFEYKLNPKSDSWVSIGSSHEIPIIPLSPGTYHLKIRAANEAGDWSDSLELTLLFLPKWYQTWWFKALVFLTIAGIFYGLYKMRIRQLRKEEKIRNQVAGDLHDELGSTLNSVKIFASLALMEKEKEKSIPHIEKIKEATQGAIAGVRDIIWVLDDKRDSIDDLVSRIHQFAKPICEASRVSYRQEIAQAISAVKLGKEEKRNLYMIIKETINNSIKYASCEEIRLFIGTKSGKLNFIISDNGKGFDEEKVVKGNGLKNIRYRAKQSGYNASISSSESEGTKLVLEKT